MDEILKQEMQKELTTRILPYWMERMVDQENGGFQFRIVSTVGVHGPEQRENTSGTDTDQHLKNKNQGDVSFPVQSVEAIHGIKMFLSWLPAVGTVLSVVFISMYPLSEKKMREVTSELEKRRKAIQS